MEAEVTTGLKLSLLAFVVVLIGTLSYFVMKSEDLIYTSYTEEAVLSVTSDQNVDTVK